MKIFLGILPCALIAACDQAPPKAEATAKVAPRFAAPDGFDGVKLGQSFNDVVQSNSAGNLRPGDLQECRDNMALRGCSVRAAGDPATYVVNEGVAYDRQLAFNADGRLTDIELVYDRRGEITPVQCRDVFGKTLDWASSIYGPLGERPELESEGERHAFKSPGGRPFSVGTADRDGSFVTAFQFSNPNGWRERVDDGRRIYYSPSRYVSLIGWLIFSGDQANCRISLEVSEPDAVKRRSLS